MEATRGQDWRALAAAADAHLLPAAPRLVAVGGLQGTGKSTLARAIAPALGRCPGALVLRTDEIRKRRFRLAPEERLPPEAYAEEVSREVHALMYGMARAALAGGQSVVLDAVFLDPAQRAAAQATAREAGARFDGIWLEAPIEVLRARVATRRGDASDANEAVLLRAARVDPGPITWHRIDATGGATDAAGAAIGLPRGFLC